MAHQPCKNPNCSNKGEPHPNCRCYQGMADGGAVEHFCSMGRPHREGCEYFAEGGETLPSFDDLKEDATAAEAQPVTDEKPLAFDDLKDDGETAGLQFDELHDDGEKYGSPSQQAIAGLEGAAQGFAGPLATLAETKILGVPAEDIAGRAEANPWTHGVSEAVGIGTGFATGVGEAGVLAKGARLVPEASGVIGKLGAAAIKGFIETAGLQAGDEITKSMLGQGDGQAPVASALANIGAAGLLGGAGGAFFKGSSESLKTLAQSKFANKAVSFLNGIGLEASPYAQEQAAKQKYGYAPLEDVLKDYIKANGFHPAAFKAGQDFFSKGLSGGLKKVSNYATSGVAGAVVGGHGGGLPGGVIAYEVMHELLGKHIEKLADKALTPAAKKLAVPVVLKALSMGETTGIWNLLEHANDVARGAQKINRGMENLFKIGSQRAVDAVASDIHRERVKKYVENGDLNQQIQAQLNQGSMPGFAEGGQVDAAPEVKPVLAGTDALSVVYPEQSMLMASAKGRVNDYLNSARPQEHQPKLPLDETFPDEEHERKYDESVDLALQPLTILNHVKDGSLTAEDMQGFSAMYPELHGELSKKMTAKIAESQLDREPLDYHTIQSMSLFLGAPLDSTLTPSSIQAAQDVFASQNAQKAQAQAPAAKDKKGTSSLGKVANRYATADQSRQQRLNKG